MERSAMAAPGRSVLRRLIPPRGLGALLGIVFIVGLCWALTVPPFQSPDETTHYAYAESLATHFRLPGNPKLPAESDSENDAEGVANVAGAAHWPVASPPPWQRDAISRVPASAPTGDGGGPTSSSANPPLYYLLAAVPYLIDSGGSPFGRLYGMRLLGVLLLLATTVGAWLAAGETFGRRRTPQLVTAAIAGLLPMATFMSTNVNPDALIIVQWTFGLWLGARVINRGAQTQDAIALAAVAASSVLTKATGYALVLPALLALAIGWSRRPRERPHNGARMAVALAVLVGPILGWLALAHFLHRAAVNQIGPATSRETIGGFLSYLWQFYLPRLGFMYPNRPVPGFPLKIVWIDQFTGTFGWLTVALPAWMYTVAEFLIGAITIGTVALLTRLRGRVLALLAYYALVLVAMLGLLHISEYRVLAAGGGTFLQGRYLLPLVGLLGMCVALILSRVPSRWQLVMSSVIVSGMLGYQVISLTTVLHAYYL